MSILHLQSISQELVTHQSVIDNVEEKGKTLQSPTVAAKLETLREQYKHLCKVVQVKQSLYSIWFLNVSVPQFFCALDVIIDSILCCVKPLKIGICGFIQKIEA